nr:hypothetical protein [Tanacetum cinerariifolium]
KDMKKDQVEDSSYEGASTSKLSSKGESHSTSYLNAVPRLVNIQACIHRKPGPKANKRI